MDLKEALLSKIKINQHTQCWEWQKGKSGNYGCMKVKGKLRLAHRLSYTVFIGEIPDKMLVCHECHNCSCINPEHLFICSCKDSYNRRDHKEQKPSKAFLGQIIRIKRALARNKTVEEIAKLGTITLSIQEIADIRDKKIYEDIGTAVY